MFNTMTVAKKIKNARIEKNITQMNLADMLNVSYQAVSNWERGNSMPDISNLPELCKALDLSLDELLAEQPQTTSAIKKVLTEETSSLSMEEIADIAPTPSPTKFNKVINDADNNINSMELSTLLSLAPFLEEELLEQLILKAKASNLSDIAALAPFLRKESVDVLLDHFEGEVDEDMIALAPFASTEKLDTLAMEYLEKEDCQRECFIALCPFLSKETVRKIADYLIKNSNYETLTAIAPVHVRLLNYYSPFTRK